MTDIQVKQDGYVDVEEAARRIGVSEKTLRKWLRKYDLPYLKMGSLVRINWPVFEKAVAEKFTVGTK